MIYDSLFYLGHTDCFQNETKQVQKLETNQKYITMNRLNYKRLNVNHYCLPPICSLNI